MLCPRCHGSHYVLANGQRVPCPDCSGMGEIHCCDGLQEQPDPEMNAPPPVCPAERVPNRDGKTETSGRV